MQLQKHEGGYIVPIHSALSRRPLSLTLLSLIPVRSREENVHLQSWSARPSTLSPCAIALCRLYLLMQLPQPHRAPFNVAKSPSMHSGQSSRHSIRRLNHLYCVVLAIWSDTDTQFQNETRCSLFAARHDMEQGPSVRQLAAIIPRKSAEREEVVSSGGLKFIDDLPHGFHVTANLSIRVDGEHRSVDRGGPSYPLARRRS